MAKQEKNESAGTELTGSEKHDIRRYTVHPVAALFSLAMHAEYEKGLANAKKSGTVNPVYVIGSEIVEGRDRVRWGLEAGVEIPIIQLEPSDDIIQLALMNLEKWSALHRNLSRQVPQRAMIANGILRLAKKRRRDERAQREAKRLAKRHSAQKGDEPHPGGAADATTASTAADTPAAGAAADGAPSTPAARSPSGGLHPPSPRLPPITRTSVAQAMGISESSVSRVRKICKMAQDLGPLLLDSVISIPEGNKLAKLTKTERKKVLAPVAEGRSSVSNALKDFLQAGPSKAKS